MASLAGAGLGVVTVTLRLDIVCFCNRLPAQFIARSRRNLISHLNLTCAPPLTVHPTL